MISLQAPNHWLAFEIVAVGRRTADTWRSGSRWLSFGTPLQSAEGADGSGQCCHAWSNAERILDGDRRRAPALEGGSHPQAPRHHLGARDSGCPDIDLRVFASSAT
jgi:hypothetical protein